MPLTFVSMYTGAGGLDLGFISAGFHPIFANDIAPDAMHTYKSAISILEQREIIRTGHKIETGDIRSVETLPERHSASLVIGGPPCQGFSVAGKMDPNDPRSRHVFDFLAMVGHVDPLGFVMENVKALAINKRWESIRLRLIAEAERLGYDTQLLILNAADYLVPQSRERMFLIGLKPEYAERFAPPQANSSRRLVLRDALVSLPPIGSPGNDQLCLARITPAKHPVLRQSPWAGMLFNGQGRPMDLDRPAPTLPASMGGNRTPIVDQESLESGAAPWVVGYHNMLMHGGSVANTIPTRLRRLTVNEAAAIQTFPVDMPWYGSQSSRYRQIGNAVPPQLARHVALSVRDAISKDTCPTDNPGILRQLKSSPSSGD